MVCFIYEFLIFLSHKIYCKKEFYTYSGDTYYTAYHKLPFSELYTRIFLCLKGKIKKDVTFNDDSIVVTNTVNEAISIYYNLSNLYGSPGFCRIYLNDHKYWFYRKYYFGVEFSNMNYSFRDLHTNISSPILYDFVQKLCKHYKVKTKQLSKEKIQLKFLHIPYE